MKENLEADVVIVGAGLTGLSLAYYLKNAGKKVYILEKENKAGGVIQTQSIDGFVFESGPTTGVLGSEEIAELIESVSDGCTLEIADEKAKQRWIWKNNRWESIPSGPISAIKTPLFTIRDKFRILGEPFRKRGNDPDESVAEMVKRRLGKSFLDYAIDPFISGVYAGDPNRLITRVALPKMYNLEQQYGSFIKGAIQKKKERKGLPPSTATKEVFSTKGGLKNLITALTEAIGKESIIFNTESIRSIPHRNGFQTEVVTAQNKFEIDSRNFVTTTGGESLNELLPFVEPAKLKPITQLTYAPVVLVVLGYKKWTGIKLNAFGGLVPSKEKRNILGVLFTSSFFSNRSPKEGCVLSIFMGGMRNPGFVRLPDTDILEMALSEIQQMLKPNQTSPDLIKIYRYPKAIPQYGLDTDDRLKAIQTIEEQFPGLILAGNIRDGIGMADRVKQAKMVADEMINE